jgi:predicted transcriptional regulator of viral defense system
MSELAGINSISRDRLGSLLRATSGAISVADAASVWGLSRKEAAKQLAYFTNQGWLSRVRRGLYVAIPLDATSSDVSLENPWVIASRLYSPCYVGGWSAAEHWDLTEQIFNALLIMTTKSPRDRSPQIKDVKFLIRTVPKRFLFGLQTIWREQNKVQVSDPSRTILDMFHDPGLGGGIRPSIDVFKTYLTSKHRNLPLLLEYAKKLGNGAVFKRLGFLLEQFEPSEQIAINTCRENLTKGTAKLDPDLSADHLITAWRLWIPSSWRKGMPK